MPVSQEVASADNAVPKTAPSADSPFLRLAGVSKSFGGVQALRGADLAVRLGEVLSLVGDNGAGKSTLVKTIMGVHPPDAGTIEIEGRRETIPHPDHARRLGIEAIYQDLALVGTFDLGDNFFLGREIMKPYLGGLIRILDKKRMRQEAQRILGEEVGIRMDQPFSPANVMSGGQRQAIAIGRAVHAQMRMIIMDEPMAALGVEETERVMTIIDGLRSRGHAVLLVSHNLEHVFRVTDRIAVMHRGSVLAVRHKHEVSRADVVAMIMGSELEASAA